MSAEDTLMLMHGSLDYQSISACIWLSQELAQVVLQSLLAIVNGLATFQPSDHVYRFVPVIKVS